MRGGEVGRGSGGTGPADAGAASSVSTPDVSGPSRGGGSTNDRGTTPVRAIDTMRGQGRVDTSTRGIHPAFRDVPTGTIPRAEFNRGDEATPQPADAKSASHGGQPAGKDAPSPADVNPAQAPQPNASKQIDINPKGSTVLPVPPDTSRAAQTRRTAPHAATDSDGEATKASATKSSTTDAAKKTGATEVEPAASQRQRTTIDTPAAVDTTNDGEVETKTGTDSVAEKTNLTDSAKSRLSDNSPSKQAETPVIATDTPDPKGANDVIEKNDQADTMTVFDAREASSNAVASTGTETKDAKISAATEEASDAATDTNTHSNEARTADAATTAVDLPGITDASDTRTEEVTAETGPTLPQRVQELLESPEAQTIIVRDNLGAHIGEIQVVNVVKSSPDGQRQLVAQVAAEAIPGETTDSATIVDAKTGEILNRREWINQNENVHVTFAGVNEAGDRFAGVVAWVDGVRVGLITEPDAAQQQDNKTISTLRVREMSRAELDALAGQLNDAQPVVMTTSEAKASLVPLSPEVKAAAAAQQNGGQAETLPEPAEASNQAAVTHVEGVSPKRLFTEGVLVTDPDGNRYLEIPGTDVRVPVLRLGDQTTQETSPATATTADTVPAAGQVTGREIATASTTNTTDVPTVTNSGNADPIPAASQAATEQIRANGNPTGNPPEEQKVFDANEQQNTQDKKDDGQQRDSQPGTDDKNESKDQTKKEWQEQQEQEDAEAKADAARRKELRRLELQLAAQAKYAQANKRPGPLGMTGLGVAAAAKAAKDGAQFLENLFKAPTSQVEELKTAFGSIFGYRSFRATYTAADGSTATRTFIVMNGSNTTPQQAANAQMFVGLELAFKQLWHALRSK